jgi:NAD(P)-dependent dehydrogenase (short-subunit alcohol dehydrogenase family)
MGRKGADRRIAITGGTRGIGRATAEALVAAGAHVAIGDIDTALAEKTAAEIAGARGRPVIGIGMDVTDLQSFTSFLDQAEAELDGLDVLINNAGIMPTGSFLENSDALVDRVIDINVHGVINGSRLAAARFTKRGHGHIVNVAMVRTELTAGINPGKPLQGLAVIAPEDAAAAIVDTVAHQGGGLRIVPKRGGSALKSAIVLPENARNLLARALGLHTVALETDKAARADYQARIGGDE